MVLIMAQNDRIRCDVTGKVFYPSSVRKCLDGAVIKRYGVGGVANVSVYVCAKCKHAIHYKWHGGLGCELERSVQTGTQGNVG